jgi:hypothetical protein
MTQVVLADQRLCGALLTESQCALAAVPADDHAQKQLRLTQVARCKG